MATVFLLVLSVFLGEPPRPGGLVAVSPPLQQTNASASTPSPLDYEIFKSQVQPILTSARRGNARCSACHAGGGGNSYLEPLPPGSETYTEEQSRRNFARVSRLVVPGEPLKSVLLVNPLDHAAGGSEWHGGGKHWHSLDNPEWQALAAWVRSRAVPASVEAGSGLNYEKFKASVQPILTSARKGNARCSACHAGGGGNSYLEPLPPGSESYTEEQSRRNFARVSRLVVPGQPLKSVLLVNPLDHEAGGSEWHGGGKHWHSLDDPEWKALAAWVSGQ